MTAHAPQPDVAEISPIASSHDSAPTDGGEPCDHLAEWQAAVDEFSANFHADVDQMLALLDEWKQSAQSVQDALPPVPCAATIAPLSIDAPTVAAASEAGEMRPLASSIDSQTDRLAALKARLTRQMHSTSGLVPETASAATGADDSEVNPA